MSWAPARPRALAPSYTTVNVFTQCADWQPVGWNAAEAATNRAFSDADDFERLFAGVLDDAVDAGFAVVDLWLAHLNPEWASAKHEQTARRLLKDRSLIVNSLSGPLGNSVDELAAVVGLAERLGVAYLAGPCDAAYLDRPGVIGLMRESEVVLGLENHPREATIDDMIRLIGEEGVLATTLDTGWWMTAGIDPVVAVEKLAPWIVCLHAKDIRAVSRHDNVPWGGGIVDVRASVERAIARGYIGAITIEYEPEAGDPRGAFPEMLSELDCWVAAATTPLGENGTDS